MGEIEKDDPSVRKIRTYMLREIRVPFVYPIPPHCTRATKTLDVRFIVLLFTSRPKRKRLEQGRVHAMTKFDEFRYPKLKNFVEINNACIFFFFLIQFEIRSFHRARIECMLLNEEL